MTTEKPRPWRKKYNHKLDPYGRRAAEIENLGGMPLTAREIQILLLLCQGLTMRAIALKIGVTPSCVWNHNSRVRLKMQRPNMIACVADALRRGVIK